MNAGKKFQENLSLLANSGHQNENVADKAC